MSTVTDNDLRELKDLINSKFDQVDTKLNEVNNKLNDMRVDIATLKEGQNGINKRFDGVEGSLNKRLDGVEARLNILISVMFTGLLGIIAKLVFIK